MITKQTHWPHKRQTISRALAKQRINWSSCVSRISRAWHGYSDTFFRGIHIHRVHKKMKLLVMDAINRVAMMVVVVVILMIDFMKISIYYWLNLWFKTAENTTCRFNRTIASKMKPIWSEAVSISIHHQCAAKQFILNLTSTHSNLHFVIAMIDFIKATRDMQWHIYIQKL